MDNKKHNLANILSTFILEDLASDKDFDSLSPDENLLEDSLVDSLGIMRLITFIEQRFGFAVPAEDVVIENFMSINAIVDYLIPQLPAHVD